MIKRTTTKWTAIPNMGMVTRIHYPVFAGKWLESLDRVCFGTLRGRIIKQILMLIGVWQEYRVTSMIWDTAHILTQEEAAILEAQG